MNIILEILKLFLVSSIFVLRNKLLLLIWVHLPKNSHQNSDTKIRTQYLISKSNKYCSMMYTFIFGCSAYL